MSEAFGFRKGIGLDYRRAPMFYSLFSGLVAFGALVALIPGVPLVGLLVGIQVFNGILLPVVLGFILVLSSDGRIMGRLRNSPTQMVLGWTTLVLVIASVLLLIAPQLFGFG